MVSEEEGAALAEAEGMCFFLETSSKENINVEEAFLKLTSQLLKKHGGTMLLKSGGDKVNISLNTSNVSSWSSCCYFM